MTHGDSWLHHGGDGEDNGEETTPVEKQRGEELSKLSKEELWERGAELVRSAEPQRRGESIVPMYSYHPWFYIAGDPHYSSAALMHAIAEADLPTNAFYALADALMDGNTSRELSEIIWTLMAREEDRSNAWSFSSALHYAFTPMVEISPQELLEPRPSYSPIALLKGNMKITGITSAVWHRHYSWREEDEVLDVMALVLKRLSTEIEARELPYNAHAMQEMASILHGRGSLTTILKNAWRGDISRFMEFHEMMKEYNLEWAVAAFQWEGE